MKGSFPESSREQKSGERTVTPFLHVWFSHFISFSLSFSKPNRPQTNAYTNFQTKPNQTLSFVLYLLCTCISQLQTNYAPSQLFPSQNFHPFSFVHIHSLTKINTSLYNCILYYI